ncbi:TPA: DnaD domain protein [Streptococcus suis]|nr:DnaD domain protein [Streptococcus suis]
MKRKKKVYFWLKLDQNFFKNLAIKHALKKVPGGKDLVLIYQMLMLESLSTEGVLYYEGTLPSLEKELAVKLDVEEEEIQMTMGYFKQAGLIQIDDENNAEMLQVPALMEQETDWARYKREQRKVVKLDNVQQVSNNSPIELEIEIEIEKEIELDIEKEIEIERDKKSLVIISEIYQSKIGVIDGDQFQQLAEYVTLDEMELDVVIRAITEAADNGKRNFKYILAILRNWKQNGIKTIAQVEERERQWIEQKASSFQNGNTSQTRKTNIPDWALEEIEQDNSEEAMQRMQALKARMLANEKDEPVPEWAEKVLASQQTAEGQAKLAAIYAELEAMENET